MYKQAVPWSSQDPVQRQAQIAFPAANNSGCFLWDSSGTDGSGAFLFIDLQEYNLSRVVLRRRGRTCFLFPEKLDLYIRFGVRLPSMGFVTAMRRGSLYALRETGVDSVAGTPAATLLTQAPGENLKNTPILQEPLNPCGEVGPRGCGAQGL